MHKIVRMVKRDKRLTPAEFKDYWLQQHAKIALRAMEKGPLRRVVASFATGEIALGGVEPPFDGMTALYFDTLDEARAALSGEATAAMREDEKNFVDLGHPPVQIVAEEYLMSKREGPGGVLKKSGQLKVVRTVYRRRDVTHAQFKDYWLKNHSKLEDKVMELTPMRRIVATFALPEGGKDPEFDGMAELYLGSLEEIRTMFSGPLPGMMRKDEENFVQMDAPAVRAIAEEYVIGDRTEG
jgi:uncharacterized protein (TIGR02118 family)